MSRQVIWRGCRKTSNSGRVPTAGPGRVVLLIDCPDRKGLVAHVASLLRDQGANILHADQHQDHELGLFFMHVEWALESGANSTQVQTSVQSSAQDGIVSNHRHVEKLAAFHDIRFEYIPVTPATRADPEGWTARPPPIP
jgi:formyltetrahydrofolate hydrolase